MSLFGITAAECNPLLKRARLYSGIDDLVSTAAHFNLQLTEKTVYTPDEGHHRAICVLTAV